MSEYNGVLYAAPAPEGVVPNFNNPHNADGLVVAICVLMPMAVVLTGLRAYTRAHMTQQHGWDDAVMEIATVLSITMCSIIFNMLNYGMGKHMWDVPLAKLYPRFMLENLIIAMIFCAASALAKLSILIMYLRIFTAATAFRYAVYVVSVFVTGYGMATVLTNLFSCSPVAGSWEVQYATTAKCINRPNFYLAQAALGIVADVATVVIPIPAISKLHMDTRKKVGVMILLSMGGFVCVVSMIRLRSLIAMMHNADLTRVTPNALMWCVIELNVSIIGGCIPAVKPLLKQYLPFLVSRSGYARSKTRSQQPNAFPTSARPHPLSDMSRKSGAISTVSPLGTTNTKSDSVEELVQNKHMAFRVEGIP